MSEYVGYVTRIKNIHKHPNADRLMIGECFGNSVIVSSDYHEMQLGVYFPTDGQLSEAFCAANDLVRRKDENGNQCGGYLDPDKRNVRTVKLRGEPSDGLFLPITCLAEFGTISDFKEGDTISTINGVEICRKYIPRRNTGEYYGGKGKVKNRRHKKEGRVVFPEHIDTEQLKFNIDNFKDGDLVSITEKLDGISHRSALLPVHKTNWFRKLFHLPDIIVYKDFCGSRRTTVESEIGGFYGSNQFRLEVHKQILPHLTPNLEVFAEIVGWPGPNQSPIMGAVDTTCVGDKEFTEKYGKKMVFHYGCEVGTYDFYIYRICELDDDGDVKIEFSTDQIIDWCQKHNMKYVPVLYRGFLSSKDEIVELGDKYADGESTLALHWREGCVIRRENNASKFDVYKNKNFAYRIMKGLAVEKLADSAEVQNMDADLLSEM